MGAGHALVHDVPDAEIFSLSSIVSIGSVISERSVYTSLGDFK